MAFKEVLIILIRAALLLTLLLFGIGIPVPVASPTASPPQEQADYFNPLPAQPRLRSWIEQLKQNPRGPFKRIRWFCNDGAVLPPKAYACRPHGGGVQHGDWIDRVKQLRQNNYLIGNLLADLLSDHFFARPNWSDQLKQILLEQFLRRTDDGWIFRQARFYRGAIQAEDERSHGRALLLGLLAQPELSDRHFLLLRTAVDLLPHGQESAPLTAMRQLAQTLEEQDADFSALRIKLHSQPASADARRVRDYAKTAAPELHESLRRLARLIDAVTRPQGDPFNDAIRLQLLNDTPANQGREMHSADNFSRASQLLFKIRTELPTLNSASRQLAWLDLSKRLESSLYRSANQLLERLPTANRRQRLLWIKQGVDALYGTGMLSQRERQSLQRSLQLLRTTPVPLAAYQREITQLTRASRWAENRVRYYFDASIKRLTRLEPLAQTFVPEQLRGSPLLAISTIIDSLQLDSQRLRGVSHQLFESEVGGLTPLNPGLARGRLEIVQDPHRHNYSAAGIYLLPQTVEDLPPVAGILTRGTGNSLSHIQLLARNLGIPNVAIAPRLQARFIAHQGEIVRLAVSPGGNIKIETEQNQEPPPETAESPAELLIAPTGQKLDLERTAIIGLEQLRATDSGRIVGPKGANLGELKQFYPQLVPDALVIPFGRFRRFLEQTPATGGQNLFAWMRSNYQRLAAKPDTRAQNKFLARLREKIAVAPLKLAFRSELREALSRHFGPDGSYGLFVRSDTNVEDLLNFSGAGLNRTVPNVVGFDNILTAIRKVWASPFTERAYRWRQAHMRNPEQLYVSVVLMLSVAADKSGVMATSDLASGDRNFLQVAVNEGVGGAVSGQRAEELLIAKQTGQVRLLAQASATQKRILLATGGVQIQKASAPERLLNNRELETLRKIGKELPTHFPTLRNPDGSSRPADIEFGFRKSQLVLFQIRPLAASKRLQNELLLQRLDAKRHIETIMVALDQLPEGGRP